MSRKNKRPFWQNFTTKFKMPTCLNLKMKSHFYTSKSLLDFTQRLKKNFLTSFNFGLNKTTLLLLFGSLAKSPFRKFLTGFFILFLYPIIMLSFFGIIVYFPEFFVVITLSLKVFTEISLPIVIEYISLDDYYFGEKTIYNDIFDNRLNPREANEKIRSLFNRLTPSDQARLENRNHAEILKKYISEHVAEKEGPDSPYFLIRMSKKFYNFFFFREYYLKIKFTTEGQIPTLTLDDYRFLLEKGFHDSPELRSRLSISDLSVLYHSSFVSSDDSSNPSTVHLSNKMPIYGDITDLTVYRPVVEKMNKDLQILTAEYIDKQNQFCDEFNTYRERLIKTKHFDESRAAAAINEAAALRNSSRPDLQQVGDAWIVFIERVHNRYATFESDYVHDSGLYEQEYAKISVEFANKYSERIVATFVDLEKKGIDIKNMDNFSGLTTQPVLQRELYIQKTDVNVEARIFTPLPVTSDPTPVVEVNNNVEHQENSSNHSGEVNNNVEHQENSSNHDSSDASSNHSGEVNSQDVSSNNLKEHLKNYLDVEPQDNFSDVSSNNSVENKISSRYNLEPEDLYDVEENSSNNNSQDDSSNHDASDDSSNHDASDASSNPSTVHLSNKMPIYGDTTDLTVVKPVVEKMQLNLTALTAEYTDKQNQICNNLNSERLTLIETLPKDEAAVKYETLAGQEVDRYREITNEYANKYSTIVSETILELQTKQVEGPNMEKHPAFSAIPGERVLAYDENDINSEPIIIYHPELKLVTIADNVPEPYFLDIADNVNNVNNVDK